MRRKHSGEPKAVTKTKELDVHLELGKAGVEFEYQKYLPFRQCGLVSETAYCFVDFAIQKPWGVLLLEVDEQQHTSYVASCDVRRDFDIAASVALGSQHKLVMLRYNPDAFKVDGNTCTTSKKDRLAKLIATIKAWDEDPAPGMPFARFFMFYDAKSGQQWPVIGEEWVSDDVRQISRCL
jgi:hypothetical protein